MVTPRLADDHDHLCARTSTPAPQRSEEDVMVIVGPYKVAARRLGRANGIDGPYRDDCGR